MKRKHRCTNQRRRTPWDDSALGTRLGAALGASPSLSAIVAMATSSAPAPRSAPRKRTSSDHAAGNPPDAANISTWFSSGGSHLEPSPETDSKAVSSSSHLNEDESAAENDAGAPCVHPPCSPPPQSGLVSSPARFAHSSPRMRSSHSACMARRRVTASSFSNAHQECLHGGGLGRDVNREDKSGSFAVPETPPPKAAARLQPSLAPQHSLSCSDDISSSLMTSPLTSSTSSGFRFQDALGPNGAGSNVHLSGPNVGANRQRLRGPLPANLPNALAPSGTNVEPTLQSIAIACRHLCTKFMVSFLWRLRSHGIPLLRHTAKALLLLLLACLALIVVNVRGFYLDAVAVCTPPPPSSENLFSQHPLIEYYVHGRGNGHYARTLAIVEKLNDAGVDVRLFVGRAALKNKPQSGVVKSKAGQASPPNVEGVHHHSRRGTTTAIAVKSLGPGQSLFNSLSLILERIMGDCQASHTVEKKSKSKASSQFNEEEPLDLRSPLLIVTDCDLPGMLRAWFGSLPAVAIGHGHTFEVSSPPPSLSLHKHVRDAWNRQAKFNLRTSFLTDWQIATNFIPLDADNGDRTGGRWDRREKQGGFMGILRDGGRGSAVVARPPMRLEVVEMSIARKAMRERPREDGQALSKDKGYTVLQHFELEMEGLIENGSEREEIAISLVPEYHSDDAKFSLNGGTHHASFTNPTEIPPTTHELFINYLLGPNRLQKDSANDVSTPGANGLTQDTTTIHLRPRRRIVACYFRDSNGDAIIKALLRSGIDVLLFENKLRSSDIGAASSSSGLGRRRRYGEDWIVRRPEDFDGAGNESGNATSAAYKAATQNGKRRLREEEIIMTRKNYDENRNATLRKETDKADSVSEPYSANSNEKETTSTIYKLVPPAQPQLIRVADTELFQPFLAFVDGVVSSGGSQLISECIYASIPMLALHGETDEEQMLNIEMIRHQRWEKVSRKDKAKASKLPLKSTSPAVQAFGASFRSLTEALSFSSKFSLASQEENGETTKKEPTDENALLFEGSLSDDQITSVLPHRLLSEDEYSYLAKRGHIATKAAYSEFNLFLEALSRSYVSANFFSRIKIDSTDKHKKYSYEAEEQQQDKLESSKTVVDVDPFQGMPDAASVLTEIVKQVEKGLW